MPPVQEIILGARDGPCNADIKWVPADPRGGRIHTKNGPLARDDKNGPPYGPALCGRWSQICSPPCNWQRTHEEIYIRMYALHLTLALLRLVLT